MPPCHDLCILYAFLVHWNDLGSTKVEEIRIHNWPGWCGAERLAVTRLKILDTSVIIDGALRIS